LANARLPLLLFSSIASYSVWLLVERGASKRARRSGDERNLRLTLIGAESACRYDRAGR
jgi:hypothetical protein